MSAVIRSLVEATLDTLEAGRFQDFCLDFLPLWDTRFVGLSRFGHTAAGKTRAGTPDLLLTRSDGSQIGVQCGTEDNYWKQAEDLTKWKPYLDAQKSVETLTNLCEVVLIANREIPSNKPNTKTELISLLKDKTGAFVTPLALEDIGQFISSTLHSPPTRRLLIKYFPEASLTFSSEEDAQRLRLGREIASERPVEASTLFPLIDQAVQSFGYTEEARQYVVGQLDELGYRLTPLPTFDGIRRKSVEALPLKSPVGKISTLVGVPKIGKTSLLQQLSSSWTGADIHWYDCPHEEECASAIAVDLIRSLLPGTCTEKLLRSEVAFNVAIREAESLPRPTIFIVDNAENLSEKGLKQLSDTLLTVKRHRIAENLAVIFASNRKLTSLSAATDIAIVAPPWSASELGDLLRLSSIQFDEQDRDKYLELLEGFSGGHPLIAKALAGKWPKATQLLLGQLTPVLKANDETLSREAQVLLYDDILKDSDSQNLVQRLSILIGHTPEDILEVLRTEVSPVIAQSARVIIDRVGGSVIEGESMIGYSIPLVFREVAKQRISKDETQRVYKVVGNRLLTPKNNHIDAGRATSGVFYLLCAGEFDKAYVWTSLLVGTALRKDLSDAQLSALLERLRLTTVLKAPEGFIHQIGHALMMVTLATAYCHIKEYKPAGEILEKVKIDSTPTSKQLDTDTARHIQIYTVTLKALVRIWSGSDSPLPALSEVDVGGLFEWEVDMRHEYSELLTQSILHYPISGLATSLVQEITRKVETTGFGEVEWCFDLACNIGVRAKREGLDSGFLERFFTDTIFGRLLRDLSSATLMIELRQSRTALEVIDQVINATQGLGLINAKCWSHLYQVRGDAAYQLEDQQIAEESYRQGLEYSQPGSFDRAWASWRLGLLKNDDQMFDKAAAEFKGKGHIEYWARAWGSRGALLIRSGKNYEGVRCFHDLIAAYFVSAEEAAGPATTLALSHLSRLKSELEGEPIDSANQQFPEIKASLYEIVLESARPLSGPVLAYYLLAKTYHLLGKDSDALACISQALDITPIHEKDIHTLPVILSDFLLILADPERDRAQLRTCVQRAITNRALGGTAPLPFLAYSLFNKADQDHRPGEPNRGLVALLELVEEVLHDSPQDERFWSAEILVRRARILKGLGGDKSKLRELHARSLHAAKASGNTAVMIESSHALGFELSTYAGSLKELAETQFAQIEAVEMQNEKIDRLLALGENLFKLWGNIDWRRLLATDLDTKKLLMDSAKEMTRADTPLDLAASAMILLLTKLFNHSGPSVEWAKSRCLPKKTNLPDHVSTALHPVI